MPSRPLKRRITGATATLPRYASLRITRNFEISDRPRDRVASRQTVKRYHAVLPCKHSSRALQDPRTNGGVSAQLSGRRFRSRSVETSPVNCALQAELSRQIATVLGKFRSLCSSTRIRRALSSQRPHVRALRDVRPRNRTATNDRRRYATFPLVAREWRNLLHARRFVPGMGPLRQKSRP